MLNELINTFEELKENVYIIDRGDLPPIIIKFKDEHFYHLIGLHKTNIDMFFPKKMFSKAKRYKYMKKNVNKFDNIIQNQTKGKFLLELRISTFKHITDMLSEDSNANLYNLKQGAIGSVYDGDYGLLKILQDSYCLLGLKEDVDNNVCHPQSWMASNRINKLAKKPPIYYKRIIIIPKSIYENAEIYAI